MFDSNKTIHFFYHRQVPTCSTDSWADPRGSEGCWGCVSPLSVQFLSFSYSLGTVYKIIGRPTRLGLAPPHLGNPESAIDFRGGSSISQSGLPDIFGLSPYNPHDKKKIMLTPAPPKKSTNTYNVTILFNIPRLGHQFSKTAGGW